MYIYTLYTKTKIFISNNKLYIANLLATVSLMISREFFAHFYYLFLALHTFALCLPLFSISFFILAVDYTHSILLFRLMKKNKTEMIVVVMHFHGMSY